MSANGHRLASSEALARAFAKAGVTDGARVILYGDSPMATGWVYTALAAIGHGDDVSWLDGGIAVWKAEKRRLETASPAAASGPLTVRPAPDTLVDAAWVKSRLNSPTTKVLDVRTERGMGRRPPAERHAHPLAGSLHGSEDADVQDRPTRSVRCSRKAGVAPDQEVVTYCAVGMRASLMYWAARSVGVPARVYVGSWQDWQRDPSNPIVK